MKKGLTEMVFILDRSGSMCALEADTIGGYNAMIKKQQEKSGEALVSTFLFDNDVELLHDRLDVRSIPPMTREDYRVRGCTALLDAVGSAIHHIAMIHKYARPEDLPESTVFVINTDGMENASHLYTAEEVRGMIRKEKNKYGWEFLFLGANIDAVSAAGNLGIDKDRAVDYVADSCGMGLNYMALNQAISAVRDNKTLGNEWRKPIDLDFSRRGNKAPGNKWRKPFDLDFSRWGNR